MCSACGYPSAPGHWTDAGASTPTDRLRNRFARLTTINRLLSPYKLKAHDDGVTPGLHLMNASGNHVLVENLEVLWLTAEKMAGRPIDPLNTEQESKAV